MTMRTLLILLYFIISASVLALILEEKIGKTIPKVVLSNIFILFVCGIVFQDLRIGVVINILLPFIIGGVQLFRKVNNRTDYSLNKAIELCITPGFFAFIFFFAFIWLANQYRVLSGWDEFTHWGLVVKNMCIFNKFGNYAYSTDYFPGYPPGTSLWEYFITKLYGSFNEAYFYRANGWMYLSFIVPIADSCERKSYISDFIATVALVLLPAVFFNNYLISLYVDAFLGVLYGYLIYEVNQFELKNHLISQFVFITIGMSVLCLVKASGVFLSLSVGIAFVIVVIEESRHDDRWKDKIFVFNKNAVCSIVSVIGALFVGKALWSAQLATNKTDPAWNTSSVTFSAIFNFIHGGGKEYQYNTFKNFIGALSETDIAPYVFNLKFIQWVAIAGLGLLICLKLCEKKEKPVNFNGGLAYRIKVVSVVLSVTLLIYTVGMLVLYLFTYSSYEAENLASFSRYMATPLVGVFYYIIRCIYDESCETGKKNNIVPGVILMVLLMFLPLDLFGGQFLLSKQKDTLNLRSKYEAVKRYANMLDYKTDKVWYISQHDSGFDRWVLRYNMTPIQDGTRYFSWSLGEPYDESDIWTNDIGPKEWIEYMMASDVRYVYLYKIDDRFIDDYGSCFKQKPKSDTMYRLTESPGGDILTEVMIEDSVGPALSDK